MSGKLVLVQYERVKDVLESEKAQVFERAGVIFDEVHKLKTPDSTLTRIWLLIRPYIVTRIDDNFFISILKKQGS